MPYLRISRAQFDPAKADEVARLMPDLASANRQLPGLQHFHGGLDRDNGRAVAVGLFDSAAHAGYERATLGDIIPRLHAAGMRIEAPEIYEVTP